MAITAIRFQTAADIENRALSLRQVRGKQRLSHLYEYDLVVQVSEDGGLSSEHIDNLLNSRCRVEIDRDGQAAPFELNGVLRRVALDPMRGPAEAVYHLTLVPELFRTTLSYGSRIFQDKSWPEIVAMVLNEHGINHEMTLEGTYPAREYTVQYEETDFAFISRLMEHFGIFYFFEQEPDGEKMIIADANRVFTAHPDNATVPYVLHFDDRGEQDAGGVYLLGRTHEIQPASIELKDYNWRHPQVVPEGDHAADAATGHGTLHMYGDHIKDPTEGRQLAQIRAEQLLAKREIYHGKTSVLALAPGHSFLLHGYPSGDLDQEYVITEVEERLDGDGAATRNIELIPLRVVFRSQRETPKPRVVGTTHAIVDGETDDMAAPIDPEGRYKLLFPFDRLAEPGGRASRWVRMAQASSGADYGIHFPLHIGCEVGIMHVGGDPDRPIIIGAIPNADTMSPVTQAEATKSRIRSKGGILMEIEDAEN